MSPEARIKWLTQKETEAFLRAVRRHGEPRDLAAFRLMYWCGLRASEVGLLRRQDLDADSGTLLVRRLKGSVSHSYQLPPDVLKALRTYLASRDDDHDALFLSRNNKPLSRKQLHVLFKKFTARTRIPPDKRHCHVLRHSVAVHMIDSGIDVRRVAYHLGHRSLTSTMVYANVSAKAAADIHEQMQHSDSIARM
mgnify:FL=1